MDPSPFLPGTKIQYALDSTSLGWFKTCPRLYYYSMIERWRPREESVHLRFGILYHEALRIYDVLRLDGLDHEAAVFQVVSWLCDNYDGYPDVSEAKKSIRSKSFESLLRTCIWYLDQYPRETDPAETVVLDDGKPACELSFSFDLNWGPIHATNLTASEIDLRLKGEETHKINQNYILCGHLDRVVNFNDNLFVMDHKTTSGPISAYYFNQYAPNNQMSLYTIAGQMVLKTEIRGVIIDAAEVKEDFTNFGRGFVYRTQDQNDEWLQDLRMWTMALETCATQNHWPMNDTACDKFGGCPFRSVCSKDESVRPAFLAAEFKQEEQWNPLKAR